MNFILKEERDALETVVGLSVPFEIEQDETDNSTVTTYVFTNPNTMSKLRFPTIAINGQVNYSFDEELLFEINAWRRGDEVSRAFSDYEAK